MQQIRDMDLIRLLLIQREGKEEVDLSEYTQEQVNYNTYLIVDAGLAHGAYIWGSDDYGQPELLDASLDYITSSGQEFLANARNETVWKQAKSILTEKGGEASFAVITALLSKLTLAQFGLS